MHGQEALFTENMTLKEVIERFKEQQLVTASTLENERTHLPVSQERLLATGECQGGIEKMAVVWGSHLRHSFTDCPIFKKT